MIDKINENVEITYEAVIEALGTKEGESFIEIMEIVDEIIENPQSIAGNAALIMAAKLAAYRTKMGVLAQLYKTIDSKSIATRRRKDIIFKMYSSLEENINTLKLLGRIESGR